MHSEPDGTARVAHSTKRGPIYVILALAVILIAGQYLFVSMTATVSGSASLPNGLTARINGQFTCSEKSRLTTIEAGGHVFTFSPTTISIDGVVVGPQDATVTDVQINATRWSASLHINGNEVRVAK